MRKIVQKQIMDMIPAIWDGVQYIQTAEPRNALHVLQDCLLAMKTLRESLRFGLSETRFAYYQRFYDQAFLSLGKIEKGLDLAHQIPEIYTGLDTILTDITKEKEVKLEILFLPYKASMWDSLESIWLAAKDDSKCDAYIMPIPYCDRNPDGSPAAWHCEADLFPEYVPVIDFHQYDIAKRKPDVIYIHNPYDEYNRVTSVDPKYYSSELKKHTDMLVYVPYFVSGGKIEPHFCQVAAVINADKVIVESEEVKKQYELAYPGGSPPEHKFLAFGSPKIDKVLNSSRTDFVLQKKWQELMQGKKVILYNTSLAAMLENPNAANKKLRQVFSVFKTRKDVVLWWRPHPLIKATMQSMHPEIFHEYANIEREYKSAGWGIYDDSVDLHRAISWSDAYYGDWSSLVWMYGVTGKPIMIQDMKLVNKPLIKKNGSPFFTGFAFDEDCIWFPVNFFTGICKFNLKNKKVECIKIIPGGKISNVNQFLTLTKIKNKLLMFSVYKNEIIEYDIEYDCFKKIKLDTINTKNRFCEVPKFENIITYKTYVFILGGYPAIIRYDTETGEYRYYTDAFDKIKKYIVSSKDTLFGYRGNICIRGNILLLPFHQKNIVLEFNMDTGRTKVNFVGNNRNRYFGMEFDGIDYWLTLKKSSLIIKWNYETGNVEEYNTDRFLGCVISQKNQDVFTSIIHAGKYMLIFPTWNANAILLEITNGNMSQMETISYQCCFFARQYDGNLIYALVLKSHKIFLLQINTVEFSIEETEIALAYDEIQTVIREINSQQYSNMEISDVILEENYLRDLSMCFDFFQNQTSESSMQQILLFKQLFQADQRSNAGQKIQEYVMSLKKLEV
jgi:hypothetical protein